MHVAEPGQTKYAREGLVRAGGCTRQFRSRIRCVRPSYALSSNQALNAKLSPFGNHILGSSVLAGLADSNCEIVIEGTSYCQWPPPYRAPPLQRKRLTQICSLIFIEPHAPTMFRDQCEKRFDNHELGRTKCWKCPVNSCCLGSTGTEALIRRIRRGCSGRPCRRPVSSGPGVRSRGWERRSGPCGGPCRRGRCGR